MSSKTSKMILYYNELCPYVHRTRIALHEKKVEFESVRIDLSKPRPDWYLKINPQGQVPALKFGDKNITDSTIINEFLEEAYPTNPLLPTNLYDRAKARWWIQWSNTTFAPSWHQFLINKDENLVKEEKMLQVLKTLNDGLNEFSKEGPYFFGEQFTLVDITLIPWFTRWELVRRFKKFEIPEDLKRLNQWIKNCLERESVKSTSCDIEPLIEVYSKFVK